MKVVNEKCSPVDRPVLCCIVPCYNEAASLPSFFKAMEGVSQQLLNRFNFETGYVFVDDGSSDSTLDLIKDFKLKHERCHYVSFTRNFGKESGLKAGMDAALRLFPAEDALFAILDADLQDPPPYSLN